MGRIPEAVHRRPVTGDAGARARTELENGVASVTSAIVSLIAALSCVLACIVPGRAGAQEMSEASFVGSLVGASEACAQADPERAAVYRDSLRRLVGCHFTENGLRDWHEALRNGPATRAQYREGLETGRHSLDAAPSTRREQCASLARLACGPDTAPARAPRPAPTPGR